MTTLNGSQSDLRYRGVDELLCRIDRVRLRRQTLHTITAWEIIIAIGTAVLLTATLCGYWPGQPPGWLRWGLFTVLVGTWLGLSAWLGLRIFCTRYNTAQAARFIEQALPEVRNDLTNSVLLAEDADQPSRLLVQCAIDECQMRISKLDLSRSCDAISKQMRRWLIWATISLGALLAFALLQPGPFARGLIAALQPMRYVPVENSLELLAIEPGDTAIFPGEPLAFSVTVRNKNAQQDMSDIQAEVVIAGQTLPIPMFPAAADANAQPGPAEPQTDIKKFQARLPGVYQPVQYFIRVESDGRVNRWPDDRPWYNVDIREVRLGALAVEYKYPTYTGLADRTETLTTGEATIQAPIGTRARIIAEFASSVPTGYIEFRTGRREAMHSRQAGRTFEFTFPVQTDDAYRLIFTDRGGKILRQLPGPDEGEKNNGLDGYYAIKVLPDPPPSVKFLEPDRNVTIAAGDKLKLIIKAADKFGLTGVQLWASRKRQTPTPVPALSAGNLVNKKEITIEHNWQLADVVDGEEIVYYATATDNRNLKSLGGPQTSRTPQFRITVRSKATLQARQADLFARLQKQLLEILRLQTHQRVNAEIVRRFKTLDKIKPLGLEIHTGQRTILQRLKSVTALLQTDDQSVSKELQDIRRVAIALTANDAQIAVDQAYVLANLTELEKLSQSCTLLGNTQDNIIRALQDMLAILPSLADKLKQSETSQNGADLTPEQRKARREKLADEIKKFIAEQNKIIQASQRLVKKPVDDFTEADKKLLHELSALEDKWEKFLNETFTDFSKLAEQDFSAPSMLKELLAVKCDVTMAVDALNKQAIEIATAAEESSVENAETLTANLEKWLPDEPDRKKWEMEALEEQQNTEQAELFTELEDLVGDLLEEEEDLFEEMDDMTSKSTMSGDKGVGWDALDGPISSMNAQGVTGNQLPNSSEVSGRSGEGRSGKSAGEFVEDKAVGKGGRRTPTRLSKDPFQKGQINDVSTDPPGGATGGGKLSGSGAEGLEGPTPAELGKELKRLAGQQAAILNRAERINARFKPGDYSAFKMEQAILLMNRVKNDLEHGRYRNALRSRKATVNALAQTRDILNRKQEIEVTEDASQTMPKYIRDNITNSVEGKLPEEYREVLQQYYRRLSETGNRD